MNKQKCYMTDDLREKRKAFEFDKIESRINEILIIRKLKINQILIKRDQNLINHLHKFKFKQTNLLSMMDMNGENVKMQFQLDEMRVQKQININSQIRSSRRIVLNLKEREYSQSIDILSKKNKQLQIEMRSINSYSRQICYLAEDWASLGQSLPLILLKGQMIFEYENKLPLKRKKIKSKKSRNSEAELMNLKETKEN